MSGASLCKTLRELGYKGDLDPNSFDWVFQYPDTRPLMHWMCSELKSSHVLHFEDIKEYARLREQGRTLEGEELHLAWSNRQKDIATQGSTKPEATDKLRVENDSMRVEIALLKRQLQRAKTQATLLASHGSDLTRKKRAQDAVAAAVNEDLGQAQKRIGQANAQLNEVLTGLVDCVSELASYYLVEEEAPFLSFMDLHPYLTQEAAYTEAINRWFKFQFHQDAAILGIEEPSCGWQVDERGHSSLFEEEARPDFPLSHADELQHLRSIFAVSELNLVNARMEKAAAQAELETAKRQRMSSQALSQDDDITLRRRLVEYDSQLSHLSQRQEALQEKAIPQLCRMLAELHDIYVYEGEYNLKLRQKEDCVSKQEQYAGFLVEQLSRHVFLQYACQEEFRTQQETCQLLKLVGQELDALAQSSASRIEKSNALAKAAAKGQDIVPAAKADPLLKRVLDLLPQGLEVRQSASDVAMAVGQLCSSMDALETSAEDKQPSAFSAHIANLQSQVSQMQQLLQMDSPLGQPQLTPKLLARESDLLVEADMRLTSAVGDVSSEYHAKQQMLGRRASELNTERKVFVDFTCNPQNVKAYSSSLATKLLKRKISQSPALSDIGQKQLEFPSPSGT